MVALAQTLTFDALATRICDYSQRAINKWQKITTDVERILCVLQSRLGRRRMSVANHIQFGVAVMVLPRAVVPWS